MSDGKNALKLSGDYIDFNLNLKIDLSPSFDAQKSIYTKTNRTLNFWFFGLICSVRHFRPTRNTGVQDSKNFELKVSFCNSPIC